MQIPHNNPLLRKFTSILLFFFLYYHSNAQVTFEKNYYINHYTGGNNTNGASPVIINTKDSGYFVISFSGNNNSSKNFVISIARMDKNGNIIWNKISDPYTIYENGGISEIASYLDSSLVIPWNNQGEYPMIGFVHLNKNGNAIWAKKYICPSNRANAFLFSLASTYDNGLISSGFISAFPSGLTFIFFLKTDSSGNIKWCKQYFPDSSLGISVLEVPRITPTPDSGFLYTFGASDSTTPNGWGYLMKTDANGNIQWAKKYANSYIPVESKPQVYKNSIIIPNCYSALSVLKLTMQGIPIWNFTYSGNDLNTAYEGVTDSNGNTFLSGITEDTLGFLFKIDTSGNLVWSHKYGQIPDSSFLTNILFPLDGGVLGYGWGPVLFHPLPARYMLVKTNASGEDGCEMPFPVTKTPLPITWQDAHIKVYPVAMTQKDTILNFHDAPLSTTTLCSVKPITKPIAKIHEVKDTLCNGYCLCFTDSSTNGPSSWSWQFAGASPSTSHAENPCYVCYSTPGGYRVMLIASNAGGSDTTYDSVIVISQPVISITGKDSLCAGDSTTLIVSPNGLSYLWNTGATSSSFMTNELRLTTKFTIQASNGYCAVKDSMEVIVPAFTVTACCDTTITQGQTVQLNAGGGQIYEWSPQTKGCNTCSNLTAEPLITTTYTVTVISNIGCKATDSVTVTVLCRPVSVCCDSSIIRGGTVQLISLGGDRYYWSPSTALSCDTCKNPLASPTQNITYTVTINDSGCISQTTVSIDVSCGNVFIPDAFSPPPYGSGRPNGILYVRGECIATMDFMVFDRWGNKVFESQNLNQGWDGTFKGQAMNTGTYMYYLTATLYDGTSIERKGNVALVR